MARTKPKPRKSAAPIEPEPMIVCTCCPDAVASEAIRRFVSDSGVDDQPWMMFGYDGVWRPIRTCPWCRTELG